MNGYVDHDGTGSIKVLGISGSLRKASSNTGLLRASQEVTPEGMGVTIFDIKDLPFYSRDIEAEGDPPPVTALKSAIREADAVMFATTGVQLGHVGSAEERRRLGFSRPRKRLADGQTRDDHWLRWESRDRSRADAAPRDSRGDRLGGDGKARGAGPSIWFSSSVRLGRQSGRRRDQRFATTTPGGLRGMDYAIRSAAGVRELRL